MERFLLELPTDISTSERGAGTDVIHLSTSNVCAGGAYFRTGGILPVGTEVEVDLILPLDEMKKMESRRTLIKVTGVVVRTEEDGMAIRFDNEFKMVPLDGEES